MPERGVGFGAGSPFQIVRRFRGCLYEIELDNAQRRSSKLTVDGRPVQGNLLPVQTSGVCRVRCEC